MNWGKGIAIFLTAFIIFITTLAVILMRANANLVSEDYYKKEVEYGSEIEAEQNAVNINATISTSVENSGLFIKVEGDETISNLKVHLLRSNNPSLDVQKSSNGSSLFIEKKELVSGKYLLTATWGTDTTSYQSKKDIWIP